MNFILVSFDHILFIHFVLVSCLLLHEQFASPYTIMLQLVNHQLLAAAVVVWIEFLNDWSETHLLYWGAGWIHDSDVSVQLLASCVCMFAQCLSSQPWNPVTQSAMHIDHIWNFHSRWLLLCGPWEIHVILVYCSHDPPGILFNGCTNCRFRRT